jgi:hypothetical protein
MKDRSVRSIAYRMCFEQMRSRTREHCDATIPGGVLLECRPRGLARQRGGRNSWRTPICIASPTSLETLHGWKNLDHIRDGARRRDLRHRYRRRSSSHFGGAPAALCKVRIQKMTPKQRWRAELVPKDRLGVRHRSARSSPSGIIVPSQCSPRVVAPRGETVRPAHPGTGLLVLEAGR